MYNNIYCVWFNHIRDHFTDGVLVVVVGGEGESSGGEGESGGGEGESSGGEGESGGGEGGGGVIDFDDGLPCCVTNMPRETELHKNRGSGPSMHPGIVSWLRAECYVQNITWQTIIKNSHSISLHNFNTLSIHN